MTDDYPPGFTRPVYYPPPQPDMPLWKTLVEESSCGLHRRVEVLGDDETGYVVSVLETQHGGGQPLYDTPVGTAQVGYCTPPFTRSYQVFMPITEAQIRKIFSYREPHPA